MILHFIHLLNYLLLLLSVAASELARQHFNDRDSSVVPEMSGKFYLVILCVHTHILKTGAMDIRTW